MAPFCAFTTLHISAISQLAYISQRGQETKPLLVPWTKQSRTCRTLQNLGPRQEHINRTKLAGLPLVANVWHRHFLDSAKAFHIILSARSEHFIRTPNVAPLRDAESGESTGCRTFSRRTRAPVPRATSGHRAWGSVVHWTKFAFANHLEHGMLEAVRVCC